ncbi:hypothetical protein IAT40_000345 [Kwoniella sp. CBS 6097]
MSPSTTDQEPANARNPRSRLDRPCDLYERLKQLCIIEIRDKPCVACRTRRKPCTFDLPPTTRKRKRAAAQATNPKARPRSPRAASESRSVVADQDGGKAASSSPEAGSAENGSTSAPWPGSNAELSDLPQVPDGNQVPAVGSMDLSDLVFAPLDTINFADASGPWSDGTEDRPIVHPPSLDLEESQDQESHFIGAEAFSSLVIQATNPGTTSQPNGDIEFRQVSNDPRAPVYFVKTASLMYGRTPLDGQSAYETNRRLCNELGSDISYKAINAVQHLLLAPIPIINPKRLESSCLGRDASGPVPYALLSGIIAHATHYLPELRPIHRELWSNALLALDDEYRRPRLATLQLALLQMYSRPRELAENAGQLTIGSGRAIGAAFLLGLHIDPSNWSLPLWEKSLRKRIWWALPIQDKWRALLYGRPSFLHRSSWHVPMLNVDDGDSGPYASPSHRTSMESFIATCRLTLVIDDILDTLHASPASALNAKPISRIAQLESVLEKVGEIESDCSTLFEADLPSTEEALHTKPTGVRSCQLAFMGLVANVHRLLLQCIPDNDKTRAQSLMAIFAAFRSCQRSFDLVSSLTLKDEEVYWTPNASHHVSNTVCLLLYIVIRSRPLDSSLASEATFVTINFLATLVYKYRLTGWDVVGAALRRVVVHLMCIKGELPELSQPYQDIATALDMPNFVSDLTVDDFLSSLGINVPETSSQMLDDQNWMSSMSFNNVDQGS